MRKCNSAGAKDSRSCRQAWGLHVEFVWLASDPIPTINHRSVYECGAAELEGSGAGVDMAKTVYAGTDVEHAPQQIWATA